MATDLTNQISTIDLNISYRSLPDNWDPTLKEDYINKNGSLDIVASAVDTISVQVDQNAADIAVNAANIATNTADIATNASNIATNTANISTNTANIATNTANIATNTADIATNTSTISTHISSTSQHGVTGNNVGTGDFAQLGTGGVVLLGAAVADIASTDATAAPAAYDQAQVQSIVDLANETKAQVNALLASLRASGSINT